MEIETITKRFGPVFPVDAEKKIPLILGWQNKASTNPTGMFFTKGVGIKTGVNGVTNLIVIDTDTEAAEDYLKRNLTPEELDTYTVKTRRGKHRYYFADTETRFGSGSAIVLPGLDVRGEGGFIISPPSKGYSVLKDRPLIKLPVYLQGILSIYESKKHGLSPEQRESFEMQECGILWEFVRKIDPSLDRNNWLKVVSIAKHYYKDSYDVALYWSALSEEKFPGEAEFLKTWESITTTKATPASLLYLVGEFNWSRAVLPAIPLAQLDDARHLALLLFNDTRKLLARGNILTDKECQSLLVAAEVLTFSLFTNERERIAIPLPTGFGKSTLIRSFIKLLHDQHLDKKVLICVSRHAEILESIQELKKMGVGGGTVGVYMSKEYVSEWDVESYEVEDKQAVYISHNRVYNSSDYEKLKFLTGTGEDERLVLWDESAQTTRGNWCSVDRLEGQVLGLISRIKKWNLLRNVDEEIFYQWLLTQEKTLGEQCYGQIWIDEISVPAGLTFSMEPELKTFIENSGCYASFTKSGNQDELLISMEIRIPDQMQSIIFDASSEIRELIGYDKSIKHLQVDFDRDYSSCQISCVNVKSSKGHLNIEENIDFQIGILKDWMAEHCVSGEEQLVVTQKPRFAKVGRREVIVDIPRKLKEEIPGIHVITWGSERGINEFRGIKYTANIGMKWRKQKDLQAEILAQKRDLGSMVAYQEIKEVQRSEFLSEIQQWITRTNMRVSKNGKAKETEILLLHSEATKLAQELSKKVFKGLQVKLFDAGETTPEQQREKRVEKVVDFLQSSEDQKVSSVCLKRAIGLNSISKDQWETISDRVEDILCFQWDREGRSWVKSEGVSPAVTSQEINMDIVFQ